MMSAVAFLTVRVMHVLLAALWIGATVFMLLFLNPAVAEAGPAGGQVMAAVARRGFAQFLAVIAGITILTGFWLYWRFTGGFDAGVSGTRSGMAFGIGGVAGLIAGIVGGAVVGRSVNELVTVAGRMPGLSDGPERVALAQKMTALRSRVITGTRIVIALQVIALSLMAIGHYI